MRVTTREKRRIPRLPTAAGDPSPYSSFQRNGMADQTNDRTRLNACEATDRTFETSEAPASSSDRMV